MLKTLNADFLDWEDTLNRDVQAPCTSSKCVGNKLLCAPNFRKFFETLYMKVFRAC